MFEQERANRAAAAVRGEYQGAHAIRLAVVHVGAGLQEQLCGLDVSDPRREQQCRGAAAQHCVIELLASRPLGLLADHRLRVGQRARANISTGVEQHLDHIGMTLCRRPHQRRLVVLALFGVDLGAVRQHQFHCLRVARTGAGHQDRLAIEHRRVRRGARGQQPFDHPRAAIGAGQMQGRRPKIVRRIGARAETDQQIDNRQVIAMRRPVERRRAVALRRVDADALPEQTAHRRDVLLFDRVNQAKVERGLRRRGRRGERRQTSADGEAFTEKEPWHRLVPCCRQSDRGARRTDRAASDADSPTACS